MTKGLKKRIFSIILTIVMMVGLLPTNLTVSFASETESEEIVIEVTSWDEFKNAFHYSEYKGESFTIKLMNNLYADTEDVGEKKTAIIYTWIYGSFVTFDFNGYTLSFNEECLANDLEYNISDFITIKMRPLNYTVGSTLRIIDSKGGGGISMDSVRAYDSQLSALHILGDDYFELNGILKETVGPINKVIIDGGEYTLNAKINKFGNGTVDGKTYYRGTVIADWVKAEINDGVFKAQSDGVYASNGDMCARELSAFATCCSTSARPNDVKYGKVIINGGLFMSDGYSIHHFDNASNINETYYMNFPKINAGAFIGKMGFLGKTYTYSEGNHYWVNQPASNVISSESFVRGINKNQEYFNDIVEMTLKDLHEIKSCYVFNEKVFDLKTTPIVDEDTVLERCSEQSEEFSISYSIPMWVEKLDSEYFTEISVVGENSELKEKNETLNVSYKDFVGDVKVILDFSYNIGKDPISFSKEYDVLVSDIQKSAEITVQPKSSQVLPGEFASTYVVADYAKSYQWYYVFEGYKFEITKDFLSKFDGVIMEGYDTPCLSVKFSEDYVGEEIFYCVITGFDGTKINTNRVTLTFGDKPSVNSFNGGEYNNTTDAEFTIWGYYMENVTWNVMYKTSGNMTIYTLDEFAELAGAEYTVKHQKFDNHLYRAMVTFKNIPESVNQNYSVGYTLRNNLGTVNFTPDNTLLFEFVEVKPEITKGLESQSCFSGENVTYSFAANNMVASEWRFEKVDEEGVMVVYTIDEMKELYNDMTFEETFSDGEASLTITNVQCELNDYVLYGYAIGENGIAGAGKVFMNVGDIEVFDDIEVVLTLDVTNAKVGDNINLSVDTKGGSGEYTYKFAVLNVNTGAWTVLKDFSKDSTYTYVAKQKGSFEFAVTVKDSLEKTASAKRVKIDIDEAKELAAELTVNDSKEKIKEKVGSNLVLKVNATGGSGTYSYKYAMLNNETGVWKVLKDFSKESTYTYEVTAKGSYQFAVTVKDSTGKTVAANRVFADIAENSSELSATLKVGGSTEKITTSKGAKIKLDVNASGGSGSYTYKFAVLNVDNGKWSVLKDFGSEATYTYALNYPGTKQFAVTVKDSTGKTISANRITVVVNNSSSELSATLKVNGSSEKITVSKGTKIKLDVNASGGSGSYTYKFAVMNVSTKKWSVLKDFGNEATYMYALNYLGTKQFAVTVKDSTGKTVSTNRLTVVVK